MYQNAIYICISLYSKICWFLVKKWWCQQNSWGVSRDSYLFWIFLRQGIAVPNFIIVGYVRHILGRGAFLPPPPPFPPNPWAAGKKSILNRVNVTYPIGWSYWRFSAWAETFNSVKWIEIIKIMWSVSSRAENIRSRDEFTRPFSRNNRHVRNFKLICFIEMLKICAKHKFVNLNGATKRTQFGYSFLQQMISVIILEPHIHKIFFNYQNIFKCCSHSLTWFRKKQSFVDVLVGFGVSL